MGGAAKGRVKVHEDKGGTLMVDRKYIVIIVCHCRRTPES